ncbi:AIPR family protein [Microcoleus sp. MON2_D5]|uniref:AIPR family protein n=1 Tax=Microcoleus sp. MON2_D5 TaxID=2818833 RepID=UPI002FD71DC4
MHKIVSSHLKRFVLEQSFDELDESKQFERFSNFCIVYKFYPTRFDISAITSEDDDCGIDGISFIVDGELVTTRDEASSIFNRPKKNVVVDIVFIQSKRSEKFERGEILKFGDGVSDFLNDSPNLPQGEFIQNSKDLFNTVIENVPKIAQGKPNCHLFYATTGTYPHAKEIEGTFKNVQQRIKDSGYFKEVTVLPVDRDELVKLWSLTYSGVEAKFEVKGYTPYPEISGIKEAYLAIVPAQNFIKNVLSDEDGKLRTFIFEENVRSFLGQDNPVNKMIKQTLVDGSGRARFGILNNGITIISPNVKVQSDSIYIENFQIVNGCQTSNVLYENKSILSDETMLTIKVVEATDPDVISEIVRATNSQTKVEDIQFLSLKPIIRKVEDFFEALAEDSDEEIKLYFERRDRQFVGQGIPDKRIFDIKQCSRAVVSMFLERPDLAARYPTQMLEELHEKLFDERNKEIAFYTASLALYRIQLLIGNKKIPYNFGKYKWHMLMCIKYLICGNKGPDLTSNNLEKFCKRIIEVCKNLNDESLNYFKQVEDVIKQAGEVNRDKLKAKSYAEELKKIIHTKLAT